MNYVYYIYNNVKYLYTSMNPATLSGAIDVIVVEQPDGTLLSTPFHVRFGKYGVFSYENKYVDIEINNEEIDLKMKLGENGVAFFVEKISENEEICSDLATSSISPLPDELGIEVATGKIKKEPSKSTLTDHPDNIPATRPTVKRSPRKDAAQKSGQSKHRTESSSSSSSDESRTPSPVQEKRTPHPSVQQQQQPRQKKPLHFSSSIYSTRRNRSLPDLSNLLTSTSQQQENGTGVGEVPAGDEQKGGRKKPGHARKGTYGTIDMEKLKNGCATANKSFAISTTTPRRVLQHSTSAISPLENLLTEGEGHQDTKNEANPVKTAIFVTPNADEQPRPTLNEEDTQEDDDESEGIHLNAAAKTNNPQQPSTSSDLADGALSDSEVDRHRNQPHMNDPEWKWGEIPKSTTKQKDTNGRSTDDDKANKSRWNWFRWSRYQQPADQTTTATQMDGNGTLGSNGTGRKEEEKGLYLQDLGSDPSKLEKYFGKRSGPMSISSNASNIDSGNGVSLGTSPCSPSALSINEETDGKPSNRQSLDNLTITETNPNIPEITPTLPATISQNDQNVFDENKHQQQTQPQSPQSQPCLMPGRGRFDSGQSDTSTATELNFSDEESVVVTSTATAISKGGTTGRVYEKKTKYKRSLRLSSDQLRLLNLDYGSNDARFSITTKLQGTAWCSCHIYLLRWDDKLVISDIDGTITKSDVLGHVIPAIGGTWAHSGVAELYTRIKNNGYQMVYLSSRAIGQSHYTKTYLQSIAQGSQTLPDGPVLLSPTSVLMAFRKEVIERKPEEFKIACLTDLKSLFPVDEPFFAGFGNRETDVKSYQSVNIPLERILIIDPSGMLRRADKIGYISDYATMAMDTVDFIFPPIPTNGPDPAVQNEHRSSEFITWRSNPQQFDHLVDEELPAYEASRKRLAEEATAKEKAAKKRGSIMSKKAK